MIKFENSLFPQDWKRIADKDWNRVKIMLRENDSEGAAYFLQQALEKYFKSFLLEQGWKLKKIHELDSLLDEAIKYKPELEEFYDLCERISGYYFTERYPVFEYLDLTCEDVASDLEEAQKVIEILLC